MKKAKIILFLLLSLSVLYLFSACVPSDKNGFQYYYSKGNKGYDFFVGINFNSENTEIVIPETFRGKPIMEISRGFRNNYPLNGDGWRTGQTDKIKSITIPSTVNYIEEGAFQDCLALEEIIISNENLVYKSEGNCVITIKTNRLIATCGSSIVPDYITNFSSESFYGAYILNNTDDSGIAYFKNWALGYNNILESSLTLKSDTVRIADYAFSNCPMLKSVILPPAITIIGHCAFSNCNSLTSIFIPSSVIYISDTTFSNCPELTIYVEVEEKPNDWDNYWNYERPVVWGYNTLADPLHINSK